MLIRPKKGKGIQERIDTIFTDPLFEQLLQLKKNASKYITPILGDCSKPGLGLSSEDCNLLIENVDVVVHSAATVRFNEALSTAFTINVCATIDMIKLAKRMLKLEAFVHVSSAFANCVVSHIEECFYADKIGMSTDKMCKMLELMGGEMIDRISSELCMDFPNTYTFTKALAEEAILTQGSGLPICVFRPSIVLPTCKEPVPGWTDNIYGPLGVLLGVAHGVIRVMYVDNNSNASFVPVDYCANMMLACCYNTAKSVKQISSDPPPIYNFVPDEHNYPTWKSYQQQLVVNRTKLPLSRMIWFPVFNPTDSKLVYTILCFLYHTIPGYIFDFFLLLLGKKRRLVEAYRKIHIQLSLLHYFVVNKWTYSMDNTQQLWNSLSAEDKRLFSFDIETLDWPQYAYNSLYGMRLYIVKEKLDTVPKAVKLLKRLMILHHALLALLYGSGAMILYWTFSKIFNFSFR